MKKFIIREAEIKDDIKKLEKIYKIADRESRNLWEDKGLSEPYEMIYKKMRDIYETLSPETINSCRVEVIT